MSKQQGFNLYLPLWEYVPDGKPHVFEGRVYVYGSHDAARSGVYCPGNYVVWAAPVDNLKDWRCEGESYRQDQDLSNPDGSMELWVPDVARGNPDYPIVPSPGAMVVELEQDMCTVKESPRMCVPGGAHSQGTGFEATPFMRRLSSGRSAVCAISSTPVSSAMSCAMWSATARTGDSATEALSSPTGMWVEGQYPAGLYDWQQPRRAGGVRGTVVYLLSPPDLRHRGFPVGGARSRWTFCPTAAFPRWRSPAVA